MDDVGLILRALEFAAGRHRTQKRKGEDQSPYINHPIQVVNLLANEGGENDPILLTAAILHDVIEDTVDTPKEKQDLIKQIRDMYGEQVLELTLEVTDDKSLEKQERKRLQVEQSQYKSVNAKKLKIADKIMNVQDITYNPPTWWSVKRINEYFDWAEKVVAGLRGVNNRLEDMFDECLKNGRTKYGELSGQPEQIKPE